jgi:Gram-negative bacterial TonB protein C-terminal
MARLVAVPVAALALAAVVSAQGVQKPRFAPPRLKTAELPPLPAPNVAGGGEVLIEATVDRRGAVIRPGILRATPPYTQFVLDAIAHWQFEPARDTDYKGFETTVDMPITVLAIYRPPVLLNTPTIGEPPKDLMKPSGDVAMATMTTAPSYPPNARDGGVVLYEVTLDETGRATETRDVATVGGFDSAARSALAQFQFRPGSYRARPVPTTTYVLFGFRPPIGLAAPPRPTPYAALSQRYFGVSSFR